MVRVVSKHKLTVFDGIDDLSTDIWIECRATMASPRFTVSFDILVIRISSRVKHDGPVFGVVIEAWLESIHFEALAVPPRVRLICHEQAYIGLIAVHSVACRIHFPIMIPVGTLPMCRELMKQQLLLFEVDDPQTLLTAWQFVVNDGDNGAT